MEISLALSIVILATTASIVWSDHQRLETLRTNHAALIASAVKIGISFDLAHPAAVRITKRERENRTVGARAVAAQFIAFAKKWEVSGQTEAANRKLHLEMMELVMTLDRVGLRIILTELRTSTDLVIQIRQVSVAIVIMTLSNERPQSALVIFAESADFLRGCDIGSSFLDDPGAKWAKDDPMAARKNTESQFLKRSEIITPAKLNRFVENRFLWFAEIASNYKWLQK